MKIAHLVAAAATVGATALFPAAASAGGNVAWSVSVAAPGIAVSAGQPFYGAPYRPYYRPYHYRPAPVVYRPYYRPYRVVVPAPVVYAPPSVVVPPPAGYPPPGVVPAPY